MENRFDVLWVVAAVAIAVCVLMFVGGAVSVARIVAMPPSQAFLPANVLLLTGGLTAMLSSVLIGLFAGMVHVLIAIELNQRSAERVIKKPVRMETA